MFLVYFALSEYIKYTKFIVLNKPYIPFIVFLILLLLEFPFLFNLDTSVVPGWHTIIYPPNYIVPNILRIVLLFFLIAYWLALKRADKITWGLFLLHLLLTILTIIFIIFPSLFLNVKNVDQEVVYKEISFRIKLIPWARVLFISGQIVFLIYFIRVLRKK